MSKETGSDLLEGSTPKILEQWAHDVNLDILYQIVFQMFSEDVHTDARVLERYLAFHEDGEVGQLVWGSSTEDLGPELLEAGKIMLLAVAIIGELFELKIEKDMKPFSLELAELIRR